jgi:hypothetical protein
MKKLWNEYGGILFFFGIILMLLIPLAIMEHHKQSSWIHVDAIVTNYSTHLEDTGIDFNACYDATFYISNEKRTVDYSYCNLVGTSSCFGASVGHALWHWDDCLAENTPDIAVGDAVIIRYNPTNILEYDWIERSEPANIRSSGSVSLDLID